MKGRRSHLSVFIQLHDDPDRILLDDPDELDDVRMIQVLHDHWNQPVGHLNRHMQRGCGWGGGAYLLHS